MFQAPTNNNVNPLPAVNMGRMNRWFKLGLDYALTIPTLLLIAPLLLVISLLIKLESPGPVLYRRRVVGATAASSTPASSAPCTSTATTSLSPIGTCGWKCCMATSTTTRA